MNELLMYGPIALPALAIIIILAYYLHRVYNLRLEHTLITCSKVIFIKFI